jgi:hypothetical protein
MRGITCVPAGIPKIWVYLLASAAWTTGLASYSLADTVMRVTYRNNHATPKTDFHITVSNSGGNPPGSTTVKDRGVNQVGPTNNWRNTPGGANNTSTSADFDSGANGAGVAPNARGDFFVHNNTNYMKITEAHWTPAELDANGHVIQAIGVGEKTTEYPYSVTISGQVSLSPPSDQGPIPFDFLLVKTGVSTAALAARSDPGTFSNLMFADFDSLPGTILERNASGGSLSGPLNYNGPPLAANTGAFFYLQGGGQFFYAWSDGIDVPEPGAASLLMVTGIFAFARLRRRI